MKTLLSLSFFICLCIGVHAQGNLQFNRAINNNYSIAVPGSSSGTNTGTATTTTTITVPAGKVWKIEACNASAAFSSTPTAYFLPTNSSNGLTATLDLGIVWGSTYSLNTPLWLAAGTHTLILTGTAYNTTNTITHNLLVTGIEFNITQ